MRDILEKLNPIPPIKTAWAKVRDWIGWPWWKRRPEVIAPEEIELVPIPPPVLIIELVGPEPAVAPSPIHVLAVDSQLKRMSVLATRYGRLPFGRRFTHPIPDGTIGDDDRQVIGGMYSGIAAGAPADETPSVMIKRIVRDPRVRPARLPRQMIGRVNEWREWS